MTSIACLFVLTCLGAAADGQRLPGSGVSVEQAMSRSDIIADCTVIDSGVTIYGSRDILIHGNMKLRPKDFLKGKLGVTDLTLGELTVKDSPEETAETIPEKGKNYLFFVEKISDTRFRGIKVLPSTKETIAAVLLSLRNEPRLPGSEVSIATAMRRADVIVIGTLLDLGKPQSKSRSITVFPTSDIRVKRALRGHLEGLHTANITVTSATPETAERTPLVNQNYLFFINTSLSSNGCFKLISQSPENIRYVTDLATIPKGPLGETR